MQTLYLETSIVSFLRSRPSARLISAARQLLTQQWWEQERPKYELVTTQFVLEEASRGSAQLAAERLEALSEIPLLEIPDEIPALADALIDSRILPAKARLDALHICAASFHRIDFLLTWNCAHIANARLFPRLRRFFSEYGYALPEVCTPEELMNDDDTPN